MAAATNYYICIKFAIGKIAQYAFDISIFINLICIFWGALCSTFGCDICVSVRPNCRRLSKIAYQKSPQKCNRCSANGARAATAKCGKATTNISIPLGITFCSVNNFHMQRVSNTDIGRQITYARIGPKEHVTAVAAKKKIIIIKI